MDQVRQWRYLLQDAFREAWYEAQREDREFLDPLQAWVNRLGQRTLPLDWRARLQAYLAPWQAKGFRLPPASVERLESRILAWARFRGFLPRATDNFVAVAAPAPAQSPAARPFVIHVAPNVSGPPPDKRTDRPRQSTPVNGLEVAGPGPETSKSYREAVQIALEVLDPVVAQWWKRPSVSGIVRSRDATSWTTFPRLNVYSEATKGGPVLIVVDQNFDAGQTAAAIIHEARVNLSGKSLGLRFREDGMARGDPAEEYRRWKSEAFQQAAKQAGALAELYVTTLASLTPAGDLVVTIGDVADHGPRWEQLLLVLPLMARGAGNFKNLILKNSKFTLELSNDVVERLSKLKDRGKSLLSRADGASTREEARAIIDRGLAAHEILPSARVAGKAASELTGDVHHVISMRVHRALEKHKTLAGKYKPRDPRFKSRAVSKAAHNGYEMWHRDLDAEVAAWIRRNGEATTEMFEAWLRERYRKTDVLWRFPEGF